MMESKLKEYIAPRMEVIAVAYQAVLAGSIVTTDVDDNEEPIGPAMSPEQILFGDMPFPMGM